MKSVTSISGGKTSAYLAANYPTDYTIFVLDDQSSILTVFQRMITFLGYEVLTFSDGKDLLIHYSQLNKDVQDQILFIIDLTIPNGLDGEEVMVQLLQINPNIKAIACSGYFEHPVMQNPVKYGFQGNMRKPFSLERLRQELEKF